MDQERKQFLIQFGKNLKRIRQQKDVTQAELAYDLGVEISQISRIERGVQNTSIANVYSIAMVLEIDLADLFEFDIKNSD